MKRNYQSWRSQLDGISSPSPSSARTTGTQPSSCLPSPPPSRSSPTLAHNLYYDRGAHIINLIKRSALKIVLLVRQLLTAAACLPARPPHPSLRSARCFSASFSAPLFIPSSHFRRFATELPFSLSLSPSPFLFFSTEASKYRLPGQSKFSKEDNRVRIERFVNTLLRRVLFSFFFGYCS